MENQLLSWIVSLITGAVGGKIAGAALKNYNLGVVGNSIAGIVGGGLVGQILSGFLGAGAEAAQPGLLGNIAGSGIRAPWS